MTLDQAMIGREAYASAESRTLAETPVGFLILAVNLIRVD